MVDAHLKLNGLALSSRAASPATPALLTRMCSGRPVARNSAAPARTDARSARSSASAPSFPAPVGRLARSAFAAASAVASRAARQEDVRAAAREDARCLGADARVGAGYEWRPCPEGRAAEHIISRRAGPSLDDSAISTRYTSGTGAPVAVNEFSSDRYKMAWARARRAWAPVSSATALDVRRRALRGAPPQGSEQHTLSAIEASRSAARRVDEDFIAHTTKHL